MNYLEKIKQASEYIGSRTKYRPALGIILGSGLGSFADELSDSDRYSFEEIPHMPSSTVSGHAGQFVLGKHGGKELIALQGRIHYYEGYTMRELSFPVRIMRALGVERLIITSACGGIHPKLYPGALMFVRDHINLMGDNPLIGENYEELGVRFPDMSEAYNKQWREKSRAWAKQNGIETFEGVHVAVSGPYFYSNAELRMVQKIGGDTIGMSMIPEVITAVHGGMQCLGIACVTDMANPDHKHDALTHEAVLEVAKKTKPKFIRLVSGIIQAL